MKSDRDMLANQTEVRGVDRSDEVDGFENWWADVQEIANRFGVVDLVGVRPEDDQCRYYDVFQAYAEVISPKQFVQDIQPDDVVIY